MPYELKQEIYERLAPDAPRYSQSSDSVNNQDDNDTLLHNFRSPRSRLTSWVQAGGKILVVLNTILLISIIGILALPGGKFIQHRAHDNSEFECAAKTSYYSPLLEEGSGAIEYEFVRFQGALEHTNVYKGTPRKELDDAWEVLTHMNASGVTGDVVDRVGKSRIAMKYSEEEGGLYFAGIEVFHQMHCLNIIRQFTYLDYYMRPENLPMSFTDPEPILRSHIDHCIDMLRQALLCQGDVGIVTYNWVKPWGPYPDFSTHHKCRKLDNIIAWADKNPVPDHDPEPGEDAVYLPGPPQ
ncbi:hypothetical protein F5Y10DRAFT_266668 [Nemania abortiva]|nr:hypothetical protein F5Y10DRAFT_266668 [Nemania abortiva]